MYRKMFFTMLIMLGVAYQGFSQLSIMELEPEPKPNAMAIINMAEQEFDFGEIEKGVPVTHSFEFANTGDAPLIISNVKTSCGCTASNYSKDAIAPGETGFIEATYNAAKEGTFNKSLNVISNGGELALTIRGLVK